MPISELFVSEVTRDIPPVVYFHEQTPDKLQAEVSEYIITGGWPEGHPNRRRVPDGIHEQYVRLLTAIAKELDRPGGPDLPNAWISGFYGSGKSSFAKLLGLALDGVALPNGTSLAEAWLRRDTSPDAAALAKAWRTLRQKIDPIAVVFDIGGVARDNEHVHTAAVRQVQRKLDYCTTEPLVADFELKLERDGEWPRFLQVAETELGMPWASAKDRAFAEDDFSLVLSRLFPERYPDPMAWIGSRSGTHTRSDSPEDAVKAIQDMLRVRRPGATLFIVVDEVSQYVLSQDDRVERLRGFAEQLGARLKGRAWLVALGQQKLEEEADNSFLVKTKDRFPPKLRVHLAPTNIRDVVHRRLLHKTREADALLRTLFETNRPDLKLFAYGCESVTPDDFVEVYPMLPGQIDLILKITSALRTRSARAQGDDQAIRGLLQLLGELFRGQRLAEDPVGSLVTLDKVYEVQHTALDADVQASMARILSQCAGDGDRLMVRAAKAVALLELVQDEIPTDARLVAQCLYDRVDLGNQVPQVTAALEELRRRNLLGYSEKLGFKIQSTAGEEWERERKDTISVPREDISGIVQEALKWLLGEPELPRLQGRTFRWRGGFSDGRRADDVVLVDPRDDAAMQVDFRFLTREESLHSAWVRRSADPPLNHRLVWLSGDSEHLDHLARELYRSRFMVRKYEFRRQSLTAARQLLLQQEKSRVEDLDQKVRGAVSDAWMSGRMYFQGGEIQPQDHVASFKVALTAAAERVLPALFQHFIATQVTPQELLQLVQPQLAGPSVKFTSDLGILELDAGRYEASCKGIVPSRILGYIEGERGAAGGSVLAHFGGPPYGYTVNVVKACVAGLLRGGKVRIQTDTGQLGAIRDAGVQDVFEKDREFKRATILPAGADDVGFSGRARICAFFEEFWGLQLDRQDPVIADAVAQLFPKLSQQLRDVEGRLRTLPGAPTGPKVFVKLQDALEQCVRMCRETKPTVSLVKKHLDVLRDGVQRLKMYDSELTPPAIRAVADAGAVVTFHAAQLAGLGVSASNVDAAATRVAAHLKSEHPWREISSLADDLQEIRAAYVAERKRLLEWQEREVESVRGRLKAREGFSTLTADQAHSVLRPLERASTDTDVEAVAPSLVELEDPFRLALRRAEDAANDKLDAILSQGRQTLIRVVDLRLHNRELSSEADVEQLVTEIKAQLLEQIRAGARIRLQ